MMTMFKKWVLSFIFLISIFTGTEALAKEAPSLTDNKEVAKFIDKQMTDDLAKFHIPGATIFIVKEDKLLYSNGYGMANAEISMFRIASTTKFFLGLPVCN